MRGGSLSTFTSHILNPSAVHVRYLASKGEGSVLGPAPATLLTPQPALPAAAPCSGCVGSTKALLRARAPGAVNPGEREVSRGPKRLRGRGLSGVIMPMVLTSLFLGSTAGNPEGCSAMPPSNSVVQHLRSAKAVCFDVDSTVITSEGVDELAARCGVQDEVKKLTSQAMGGSVPFQVSLRRRLNLMKPSRKQIDDLLQNEPSEFSRGIQTLVKSLHSRGVHVFLLSGGFKQMIHPLAAQLGIPEDYVYANDIRFDSDGNFKDFDPQAFTSCEGGKKRAIEHIRSMLGLTASDSIVMIGDGATDLEARNNQDGLGGAEIMIGFSRFPAPIRRASPCRPEAHSNETAHTSTSAHVVQFSCPRPDIAPTIGEAKLNGRPVARGPESSSRLNSQSLIPDAIA